MSFIFKDVEISVQTRIIFLAIIWLVMACGMYYGIGSLNMPKFNTLSQRGVETIGKITKLEPRNHASVSYSFFAKNGKGYFNIGHSGFENPDFNALAIGQTVIVFYDDKNPDTSSLGYPKDQRKNELISLIMAAVGIPTFMVVVLIVKGFLR